ncbi:hypothetical protein [Rhodanobacter sp. UC4451_H18]
MVVILDASTLINLANGGVLGDVLVLDGFEFLVGEAVLEEIPSIAEEVEQVVATGLLRFVDDNVITAKAFSQAKREMRLGDGETECILAAGIMGCCIACDDKQARREAKARLDPEDRVTGSIGLLRALCAAGKASPHEALAAYQLMIERGGYLPEASLELFSPCLS